MSKAELITFVIAMLAITNPIGNLAIFASLTGDKTTQEKRKTALVAGFAIVIILIIVTWTGDLLLRAFGIGPFGRFPQSNRQFRFCFAGFLRFPFHFCRFLLNRL